MVVHILFFCIFASVMFLSLFYFLPCVVSLLWFASFLFKVKNQRQQIFTCVQAFAAIYYAAYAVYVYPITDYYTMVRVDPICIPAGLCMMAYMCTFMHMHLTKKNLCKPLLLSLLIPAIVEGSIVAMLYFIIGFDNAAKICEVLDVQRILPPSYDTPLIRAYSFLAEGMFEDIISLMVLGCVGICICILYKEKYRIGDVIRFLFKGEEIATSKILALLHIALILTVSPLLILGRLFYNEHVMMATLLTILLSIILHCIAYVEFYSDDNNMVSLFNLSHLIINHPDNKVTDEEEAIIADKNDTIPVEIPAIEDGRGATEQNVSSSRRHKILLEQFNELLVKQKLYKDENLCVQMLCDKMGISRTTLSTMINVEYGKPFRDIVNHYRIEEAKSYMLANPKATQETVAFNCGFKNAQYLNSKFKEKEGVTPLVWLDSQKT